MIDYLKLWCYVATDIERILASGLFEFKGTHSHNTGVIQAYPLVYEGEVWKLEIKSPTWIEITGSLHRYWNNGTNGNDFNYENQYHAIVDLCNLLLVNPYSLTIHNIEFSLNLLLDIDASRVLRNVICYKNTEPLKRIDDDRYFTEYKMNNYYLKLYDKGKQARNCWGMDIGNVLRVEIKAMRSKELAFANIRTLADLLNRESLQVLGSKIYKVFQDVVFNDDTIDINRLTKPEQKNYLYYSNPLTWSKNKGNKTSTIAASESKFRQIVAKYGGLQLSATIGTMILDKWQELMQATPELIQEVHEYLQHCENCRFSYLRYTRKTYNPPERRCMSCGRDISHQHASSKFCAAKYVGEQQAHKCRNDNSNPRNNQKRRVEGIYRKGQPLFDITPYLANKCL